MAPVLATAEDAQDVETVAHDAVDDEMSAGRMDPDRRRELRALTGDSGQPPQSTSVQINQNYFQAQQINIQSIKANLKESYL